LAACSVGLEERGEIAMPTFTQAELEELVDQNGIVGLTLDTTEFFHVGYNYEAPSFKALGQFASTGIIAIFSEVVLNEVHADVRDDIEKKSELVRSSLNQVSKVARLGMDVKQLMTDLGIPDASGRSKELLDAFINKIEGERVVVDEGATARKLHDLYFAAEPPFSKKAEKKSEFPDAMALLSLEHWAEQHGGYVLAVSADGDWKRFGASSNHIICIPQLAAALSLFNRSDAVVAGRLSANLLADTAAQLRQRIDSLLDSTVESFEIEANAPYYYETEDEYATIDSWAVDDYQFDVIDSDDDSVTIAFTVTVNATFRAGFTFEVRDSIDKDYITIGGTQAAKEETFSLQIVVSVGRDDDGPDPDILNIEAEGPSIAVNFGYVDVDYGDEPDF